MEMGHRLSYCPSRQAIYLPDSMASIHLQMWFPEDVESRPHPILSSITGGFLFHSRGTRKTAHIECGLGKRTSLSGWSLLCFAEIPCGDHSHYNVCATSCPATCSNPLAPWNCTKPCVEGCECDEGFVLSGAQCVPREDCGCVHGDQYYEVCSQATSGAMTESAATFTTLQGPHLFLWLFSNRKERPSGSRIASANVAAQNMATCPASQTVAKKTKSVKYRMASWDATLQTRPPVTSTETLTMSPSMGDSIISRVGAITPQCKSAATPPSASP